VPQALDILRRAALRDPIPREQGVALAREVVSSTVLGRLCLAVLDGGSARALVELAAAVCREAAGGEAAAEGPDGEPIRSAEPNAGRNLTPR
jgi:hypothetical protein